MVRLRSRAAHCESEVKRSSDPCQTCGSAKTLPSPLLGGLGDHSEQPLGESPIGALVPRKLRRKTGVVAVGPGRFLVGKMRLDANVGALHGFLRVLVGRCRSLLNLFLRHETVPLYLVCCVFEDRATAPGKMIVESGDQGAEDERRLA